MGILNRPSDGLPSVLVILIRTLRKMGPMPRETLEALVAPPTLQHVHSAFKNGEKVRQTLTRWLQIGLFEESDGTVRLSAGNETGSTEGTAGLRLLGAQLRERVLLPANNEDLLRTEPSHTADFTHALCWMLAQDPFQLTTGGYKDLISQMESKQFPANPWAFQNDTRWAGFLEWAPLLGFGWHSGSPNGGAFITDPTAAVGDSLADVFAGRAELAADDFLRGLATALPVVDGGAYRTQMESRLVENTWHTIGDREVSPTLSLSLLRLHEAGRIELESRSDAPDHTLLGQGFAAVRKVSHFRLHGAK